MAANVVPTTILTKSISSTRQRTAIALSRPAKSRRRHRCVYSYIRLCDEIDRHLRLWHHYDHHLVSHLGLGSLQRDKVLEDARQEVVHLVLGKLHPHTDARSTAIWTVDFTKI